MFIIDGEQQPHGSINRVYFPKPCPEIPDEYKELEAFDLLSTAAIQHFYSMNQLVFPQIYKTNSVFINFFEEYGRRIAYTLYILHVGSQKGFVRRDWNSEEWLYWHNVKNIILGGGICDTYWDYFFPSLQHHLKQLDLDLRIIKHSYPSEMVLHGLKSHCQPNQKSLLLDFGGTRIKKLIITKENVETLERYKTSEWITENPSKSLLDLISREPLDTFDNLFISIASYLKKGVPVSQSGLFGKIGKDVGNIENFLYKSLNFTGNLKVFHDTSAAADPYRNQHNTVVITLGTAIGIGYI